MVIFLYLFTALKYRLGNLLLKVYHEFIYLDCFFDCQIVTRNYCKGVIWILPMILSSQSDSHMRYLSVEQEECCIVLLATLEPDLSTLQILIPGKIEMVQD